MAEYDNFFTAFVSRILINEPGAKQAKNYLQVCPWEVLPVDWSFFGPKYKGNGHNFTFYFILAITF